MDIINGTTRHAGKPILNENEKAGMVYSIEPSHDSYKVYQIDEYPDHSVMAGQTRKRFIDSFPTEAAALEHYPSATVEFVDPHNSFSHLPDENDPVAGGMFPDDFPEDDELVPHDYDNDDAIMAEIDAAHHEVMSRYDNM